MNQISLSSKSGILQMRGSSLSFTSEHAAIQSANAAGLAYSLEQRPTGKEFAAQVTFLDEPFLLRCMLRTAPPESHLALIWQSGRVSGLGWDATEEDLLADRDQLVALLSNWCGMAGTATSNVAREFRFPWGRVLVGASLQAMVASVTVEWN